MRRTLLGTAVVVLAVVLATPGAAYAAGAADAAGLADGGAADQTLSQTTDEGTTDETTPDQPGERLGAVVGVGSAEVSGELERKSFRQRFSSARTNRTRAAVVSEQLNATRDRLRDLQQNRQQLEAARENGTVSPGRYRAELAALSVRIAATQRLLENTGAAAETVPVEALRNRGVKSDDVAALRENASGMAGPDVAAAAREIAGEGRSLGTDRGPATAPPTDGVTGRDRADDESAADDRAPGRNSDRNRTAVSADPGSETDGIAGSATGANLGGGERAGDTPADDASATDGNASATDGNASATDGVRTTDR